MEFIKCLFVFIELIVVIKSSYSYLPHYRTWTLNNRPSSIIPRQCETPVLKNGSVRLRQRGRMIRYTCDRTFTLFGQRVSYCKQGQWENPVPMCIKPGCAPVVIPENGFIAVDDNGASNRLFCRPGYSVAGSHETYCDGTVWDRSLGTCRETHTSPPLSCDFEVDSICDWMTDSTNGLEWTRKNGYTSVKQLQTGPPHDHTIGIPLEGHFMLATFAAQSTKSTARLISPLYSADASKDACFRFFYHMYGAVTGSLRVYLKPESVTLAEMIDSSRYLLMEKNGSYENAWQESVFAIDKYDEDFQIVIQVTPTAVHTTRSNIAIDDVALLSGADCTNEESKSTAVTPEEGGIFDAQSCVNRCDETGPYSGYITEATVTSLNKTVYILQCDCYDGCVDRKSCCLDYRSVCVFDFPTIDTTDLEHITEIPPSTNASLTSTLSYSSKTKSTSTLTSIPIISTTKTISTKTYSTLTPTTIKLASTTSKASLTTTTAETTSVSTKKPTTPTGPTISTMKYDTTSSKSVTTNQPGNKNGTDDEWQSVNNPTDTDPLPTNLLYMFVALLLVGTVSMISFKLYRKYQKDHYNYKSKSKQRYSEDASDEQVM